MGGFIVDAAKRFIAFVRQRLYLLILFYYAAIGLQFSLIEQLVPADRVQVWVSCPLDQFIPYVNVFVIPYLLWFPYIGVALALTGIHDDRASFLKFAINLFAGMTLCFAIYLLVPNGQLLREPLTANESNIFDRMVYSIYADDTNTNVCPSIHVLNSMITNFAIQDSHYFRNKPVVRHTSTVLNVFIIASTVLIKQHSFVDVVFGIVLSLCIYAVANTYAAHRSRHLLSTRE